MDEQAMNNRVPWLRDLALTLGFGDGLPVGIAEIAVALYERGDTVQSAASWLREWMTCQ